MITGYCADGTAVAPPTLVASVYGMNFRVMPELEWQRAYPWALAAMLTSAVIPFFFSAGKAGFDGQ
ncbi:hypothetical protein BC374_22200 [Ensifer sp. LC13]|nr:hypothetical protein BC362_24820 [Ensifer sp. LC14]OCP07345.1 hypothetical protein BBX50_22055 [Ensifer sp. LC11]OCP08075.1 hypothetical protein BC374_22200 [Ensifer sp. LC13]OCP31911.1 hypothetical protein BC364_21455 [Ensifer sp. LC499]